MDDKFLYENRPPVRTGFGESLYARIAHSPHPKRELIPRALAFQFVLAGLIFFATVLAISEPVRADVLNWIRQVAGFGVQESDTLAFSEPAIPIPVDGSGSLERIRKDLPYEFEMPAYVPDGFHFEDKVEVQAESIFMRWLNEGADEILMVVDTEHGQLYLTGTDAAEEIQINGQPAMLLEGGYDSSHNWDPALKMTNIVQRKGNLIYWLVYVKNSAGTPAGTAVEEELIRMMASIPNK